MVINEELFKDFEDKKEEKKEEKRKMDKDAVEIRIKLDKKRLERAIFIVIILILLTLVFYNPFAEYKCKKGLSEITSEPVIETEEKEPAESAPIVEVEKETAKEEKKEETKTEEKTGAEEETELSGKVALEIDDIQLDANKTKVQSITVKIDNQKKIFTPLLKVYWYDDSTEEAVKLRPNGGSVNFTGPIPTGRVTVKKLDDELANKRLRVDDANKETFKVEVYDKTDDVVMLGTATKTINTD